MDFSFLTNSLLIAVGIGFVIFWHELGHFLAAKWAGVKVEQFAVGFGQALLCWRKGLGFTAGTSLAEYEKRAQARLDADGFVGKPTVGELDAAARSIGLSETEYRLNWIPLGGYVKMLGQDDMDPTSQSHDPRSYNKKSVAARMVIVSAGVIMNAILAAWLFFVLFLWIGFQAPAPMVGFVQPGSPAQQAGLQVGDEIRDINGHVIHDFTKVPFNVALLQPGVPATFNVKRDGNDVALSVTPQQSGSNQGMLTAGFGSMPLLQGPDAKKFPTNEALLPLVDGPSKSILAGDKVVAVNGQPIDGKDPVADFKKFSTLVYETRGQPIKLSVRNLTGIVREETVFAEFSGKRFNDQDWSFAGMRAGTVIASLQPNSSAKDKILPGDIIESVRMESGSLVSRPSVEQFIAATRTAGEAGQALEIKVIRGGESITLGELRPTVKIAKNRKGFGIAPQIDAFSTIVADVVKDSAAEKAGIRPGAKLVAIAGGPVANWYDVHRALTAAVADKPIELRIEQDGQPQAVQLFVGQSDVDVARSLTFSVASQFDAYTVTRKTSNPLTALAWGMGETRDLILKGYLTLRRVVYDRSVPAENLVGIVGIFHSGTAFAGKGWDWYVWFLAMISANLAVVNFLPIPIVDGGLFCFLLLEKLTGRPPSPRLQTAAQIVGLVLILSLFVFVTYNDIARIING